MIPRDISARDVCNSATNKDMMVCCSEPVTS